MKMKKRWKRLGLPAAILLALALLGRYIAGIPTEYTCYPDQNPAANTLYTLEAVEEEQGAEQYNVKVKLFGLLPIKNAVINRIAEKELVVLGTPFGIKLYTKGVVVVDAEEGSPAVAAGIRVGDVILSYNRVEVTSNEELREQVQQSNGQRQAVQIRRNQRKQTIWVTPEQTEEGYSIGLWVRDSAAGLGTLTYYDPETNTLAGLGHPITDVDTGQVLPVQEGTLVSAVVTGVKPGEAGDPGELLGYLQVRELGQLTGNLAEGVFAEASAAPEGKTYPIALKSEIREGEAQILCTLSGGQPESYTVEITRVNNNLEEQRNLCITVTDPRLLAVTGGIVQGMSGSPILQNGRLIGAVTHVLIDNPAKGYGILIENMLSASE